MEHKHRVTKNIALHLFLLWGLPKTAEPRYSASLLPDTSPRDSLLPSQLLYTALDIKT